MNKHPLTAYREANGLTMAALAGLLGVQPAAVSRWEAGDRFPRPDQLARIQDVTNGAVSATEMVEGKEIARRSASDLLPSEEAA